MSRSPRLLISGCLAALFALFATSVMATGSKGTVKAGKRPSQTENIAGKTIDLSSNGRVTSVVMEKAARSFSIQSAGGSAKARGVVVGDFNGDGIPDIAMAVPDGAGSKGALGAGAVYIVFGKETTQKPDKKYKPDVTILGAEAGDNLGFSLAVADFNGDGVDDLIIGAPGATMSGAKSVARTGGVFVLSGSALLKSGTYDLGASETSLVSIFGQNTGDQFGYSLAAGKLVAGATSSSLLIGAPGYTGASADAGRVAGGAAYLVSLRTGGSSPLPGSGSVALESILYGPASGELGFSLAMADVDADGYVDLLVGAPGASGAGAAYFVHGGQGLISGASAPHVYDMGGGDYTSVVNGEAAGDRFGSSIGAADVTGDGFADLSVGAPNASPQGRQLAGQAYVLAGGADFSSKTGMSLSQRATVIVYGAAAGDHLGASVWSGAASSGSSNDLLVGAPGAQSGKGNINVFYGGASFAAKAVRDLAQDQSDLMLVGQEGDGLGLSMTESPFGGPSIVAGSMIQNASGSGKLYVVNGVHPSAANLPPVVTVTSPTAGTTIQIGQIFPITWTATDPSDPAPPAPTLIQRFDILLSTDGGHSFLFVVATNISPTVNTFSWVVNTPFTTFQGKIRVIATDNQGITGSGDSDAIFSIVDPGVPVTLLGPLGGQSFSSGQSATISWTVPAASQNRVIGYDLFLSTDSGVTFNTQIVGGLDPNSTSFNWIVPALCTTHARIRVVATTLTGVVSTSDSTSDITIVTSGPTVDPANIFFDIDTGRLHLVVIRNGFGAAIPFVDSVLVEISSDDTGANFMTFNKVTKVKRQNQVLVTRGTINGVGIGDFILNGDTRILRVTNPPCGVTQFTVRRFGFQLVQVN